MEGLTTGSIISGILASIAFYILGFLTDGAVSKWQYRNFKKIWKQFIELSSAKVVITTRPGPQSSSTTRVSLPEVRAFQSIEGISSKLGLKLELVESTHNVENLTQENLILLGGPKANNISKHYWPEIQRRIPYEISLETQSIVSANKVYSPITSDKGLLIRDYSLVVKMKRENSSRFLFLFAGCHGFGTSAGTRIVSDPSEVSKFVKRVSDKEFVAIVESQIQNGIVDTVSIVDIYLFA